LRGHPEIGMFAIVETSGKQYRVAQGDLITVDHVAAEPGSTVTLDRVLMLGGEKTVVGSPTVAGASITAKVVEHFQGDKVITYKFMRTRRFRRRVGFRHSHTTLEIVSIS
jgi:large subunit ribosomal protein L21